VRSTQKLPIVPGPLPSPRLVESLRLALVATSPPRRASLPSARLLCSPVRELPPDYSIAVLGDNENAPRPLHRDAPVLLHSRA
jgi:hypothetical protein